MRLTLSKPSRQSFLETNSCGDQVADTAPIEDWHQEQNSEREEEDMTWRCKSREPQVAQQRQQSRDQIMQKEERDKEWTPERKRHRSKWTRMAATRGGQNEVSGGEEAYKQR